MILFVSSFWYQCNDFKFEHEPVTTDNTGIIVDISSKGFQSYIDRNLDFSITWLQTTVLPDISLNVAGFDVLLSDLHIGDVTMPEIKFTLVKDGCDAEFNQWKLQISFQFSIVHTTYPYVDDHGPGFLRIGLDAAAELFLFMADDCPYHFGIGGTYFKVDVFDLAIKMEGKLGWLYDSILTPLTEVLKEMFSGYLGQILAEAIIEVANNALYAITETGGYGNMADPSGIRYEMDQRWTLVSIDTMLHAYSVSQICKRYETACGGVFVSNKSAPKPSLETNRHIQYYIGRNSIQSAVEWFRLDYYDFSTLGIEFNATFTKFVNTGALLHVSTEDTVADFLVTIQPGTMINGETTWVTSFKLVMQRLISCEGGHCGQESISAFIENFNGVQEHLTLVYNNGNGVDGAGCAMIYINDDWALAACDVTL